MRKLLMMLVVFSAVNANRAAAAPPFCSADDLSRAAPEEGAVDVPVNAAVRLIYESGCSSSGFEVVTNGVPHPGSFVQGVWIPDPPLKPLTRYEAQSTYYDRPLLTFTTGTRTITPAVHPPRMTVSVACAQKLVPAVRSCEYEVTFQAPDDATARGGSYFIAVDGETFGGPRPEADGPETLVSFEYDVRDERFETLCISGWYENITADLTQRTERFCHNINKPADNVPDAEDQPAMGCTQSGPPAPWVMGLALACAFRRRK